MSPTPTTLIPDLAVPPAIVQLVDQDDRTVWRGAWPTELPQAGVTVNVPSGSSLGSPNVEGAWTLAGQVDHWNVTAASATALSQVIAVFSVYPAGS